MKKVVVIGGGISGLCSAYYLLKEGCQVTVIDKGNLSTGASFINAGYLTPSHFISLAAPGIINKGLKWMFNSASPFAIKPRWDLDFFSWVVQFKKSATAKKVELSIPVLKELNLKSQYLYEEMLASLDFDFHYEKKGVLMVYNNSKSEEEELKIAERAIKEGLVATCLSKEALQKLEPVFSNYVTGAIHYKCDSHTTPNQFMKNMKNWLQNNGVVFKLNEEVKNFKVENNKITAIRTDILTYKADEYVLATGSWTSHLASLLKLKIPVQGGKGYSMDVFRPTEISIPAILVEAKVAVTPMQGFSRFAGTMEFSGNNTIINKKRVNALAKAVKTYYKSVEINEEEKKNVVSGLRPVSPDGIPFIGKTSKYNNLTIATGHAMMGWSLGPVTGKLVTQIITKRKPLIDLTVLSPDRFN